MNPQWEKLSSKGSELMISRSKEILICQEVCTSVMLDFQSPPSNSGHSALKVEIENPT